MSENNTNMNTAYLETWTKLFINQHKTNQLAGMFSIVLNLTLLSSTIVLMFMQGKLITVPTGKDALWFLNTVVQSVNSAKTYFFMGFACAVILLFFNHTLYNSVMKSMNKIEDNMKLKDRRLINILSYGASISMLCSYIFALIGVVYLLFYLGYTIDLPTAVFTSAN